MPSSDQTTLTRIQQEIQDVINRERELKKLAGGGRLEDDSHNEDDEPSEEQKSTFTRIQEEIQNVLDRERELKQLHTHADHNDDSAVEDLNDRSSTHSGFSSHTSRSDDAERQPGGSTPPEALEAKPPAKPPVAAARAPFFRAKSTSALEERPADKPHFRRLVSVAANPQKGVMQRFLKSRGKLQAAAALTSPLKTPFANGHPPDGYSLAPPKVPHGQGQFVRRNYIPTEKKIQQDIEATYKRETELKTLRQSQGNLAVLNEAELDAPLPGYGLRSSKSMAQLYTSTEDLADGLDAPPAALKPAKSLAQLCDAKDEEVTSPQALITHFQQMIRKNQVAQRP